MTLAEWAKKNKEARVDFEYRYRHEAKVIVPDYRKCDVVALSKLDDYSIASQSLNGVVYYLVQKG